MKTHTKIAARFVVGTLTLIGAILLFGENTERVHAETTQDIQSKIDAILAQITSLPRELTPVPPRTAPTSEAVIPSTFRFTRTLNSGARGSDVKYLQILLNRDPQTQVASAGQLGGAGSETDFFGAATRKAVIAFQNKYAAEVLLPAGLERGTGTVGALTRGKLNALIQSLQGSSAPSVDVPTSPFSTAVPVVTGATTTPTLAPDNFSFDELNRRTRAALVNVLCTSERGGTFNPISGSGVIIDPRGVILTNAHVGQYFLLKDYPVPRFLDCTIRSGEPARNRYKATLLYLSPLWIAENAQKINISNPTGTGEHDFALLLITDTADPSMPLPAVFPSIPIDITNKLLLPGTETLAAAYPAGFLSGINIQRDLYPTSVIVRIGSVYSFGEKDSDIFSIGGSILAQHGSSGGAVVNTEGKLMGLIVTSTGEEMTGDRDLNALTMSHIDDSFRQHTGDSITSLLEGDVGVSSQSFNENVVPAIRKQLIEALTGN